MRGRRGWSRPWTRVRACAQEYHTRSSRASSRGVSLAPVQRPSTSLGTNEAFENRMAISMTVPTSLTLRRPDDWHVHLRDGAMLEAVAPWTARQFARAIVMPNLDPPVTTIAAAEAYRAQILAALPAGAGFTPLMTSYLTDEADARELASGYERGAWAAAKLYPAHATTNSAHGVT